MKGMSPAAEEAVVRKHLSLVLVVLFGTACAMLAQDSGQGDAQPASVAGKWQLSSQGRTGPRQSALDLQQDGSKLTGTFAGERGSLAITGTVSGNNITFTAQGQGHGGHSFSMSYSGTVEGDKMSGTMQPQGGETGGGGGHHHGGGQNHSWSATRQAGNSSGPGAAKDDSSDDPQPGA